MPEMTEQTGVFSEEEVRKIAKEQVDLVLESKSYNHNQVGQWTSSIVEQTLAQLTKLGKSYKYIVHCVIMQKTGAGLHMANSCYWDNSTDGSCCYKLETNKTMYCVVNIYACAV